MISLDRFERLLNEDESNYLEFKEELDLQSNGSKAKFLREVLSLANTQIRSGYVIIGVEDKTKALVGLKNKITEEQIQQIVSEYCRPPIRCTYQNIEYKSKMFGVAEVYPLRPPYTLKKSTGYDEPTDDPKRPKKIKLRENQVFIRRGSIIEEATIDELLEMFQADTVDMSEVVSQLKYVQASLDDIASETSHLRYIGRSPEPNEVLETIFVSLVSAMLLGSFWYPENVWLPIAALPAAFVIMIILSTLRIIHFGVRRIIAAGVLIGPALTAWLTYGPQLTVMGNLIQGNNLLGVLYQGSVGALIGLVVGIILMLWGPSDY